MTCCLRTWAKISLARTLLTCCATCLTRSYWRLYKIVQRVCCSSSCRTFLLRSLQRLFQFRQVPVGSVSRLRGGNQAKKAQRFKVSILSSHAGPGSAKTDSFLCSFLGSPPISSFSGVVAGTGIEQRTGYLRLWITRWMVLLLGALTRCDPKCGQRVGAVSPVAEMKGLMVPVSYALSADEGGDRCFENTGDFHVPKLHDEFSTAGAGGRRAFSSSRSVKRCSSSTLSRSQLDDARDSARLRRAGGRRTFSSSLSMKRCSSSTLSAQAGSLC